MIAPVQTALLAHSIASHTPEILKDWMNHVAFVVGNAEHELKSFEQGIATLYKQMFGHLSAEEITQDQITEFLSYTFAQTNCAGLREIYSVKSTLTMMLFDDEIAELATKAPDGICTIDMALQKYLELVQVELKRQAVQDVISMTTKSQFLQWMFNLNYQCNTSDKYDTSLLAKLIMELRIYAIEQDISTNGCEWSLDEVPETELERVFNRYPNTSFDIVTATDFYAMTPKGQASQ